jgi:hypothetical protein
MARRKVKEGLEAVAERFSEWRRGREVGERIPEPLWLAAVNLVPTTGLCRTATALNLDYYGLKKRCDLRVSDKPQFVELPSTSSGTARECLIELEDSLGAKMRIHIKGDGVDIESLASTFWRG